MGRPDSRCDLNMLREAHAIIKAANKDARLVGPAVGANSDGVAYLKSLIGIGLLEYVDAVSVHYYVFHRNLLLEEVKGVVAGRKPIWITETGWTTADQEGGEDAQLTYIRSHYNRDRGVLRIRSGRRGDFQLQAQRRTPSGADRQRRRLRA